VDKKLIYILNHYSTTSVQHFYHIINLVKKMADKGVDIVLIIEKCEDIPEIYNKNIKVICQKETRAIKRVVELYIILKNLIKENYNKIFIRISINSAIVAILASKFHKVETYYWQSGTTYEIDKQKKGIEKLKFLFIAQPKFWFLKKFINYFVTGPETMIDYYVTSRKINRKKMLLLYNDIDIKRFHKASRKKKAEAINHIGFDSSAIIILMVHRLSPVRKTDKYIPYIMEDNRVKRFNIHLVIVGGGPERKKLEKLVLMSSVSDRIHFVGSKPNNEIVKYYHAATLFINPSYTEGFPRVVIEAMACGLPIIATDAGGTKDIFNKLQKSYITNKESIIDFKKTIFDLITDGKQLTKLGNENISMSQKYSTENISDMYIKGVFGE